MLHELSKRLARHLRIHRDIARLKTLDDYLLADVGVPREQIASYVKGECR